MSEVPVLGNPGSLERRNRSVKRQGHNPCIEHPFAAGPRHARGSFAASQGEPVAAAHGRRQA